VGSADGGAFFVVSLSRAGELAFTKPAMGNLVAENYQFELLSGNPGQTFDASELLQTVWAQTAKKGPAKGGDRGDTAGIVINADRLAPWRCVQWVLTQGLGRARPTRFGLVGWDATDRTTRGLLIDVSAGARTARETPTVHVAAARDKGIEIRWSGVGDYTLPAITEFGDAAQLRGANQALERLWSGLRMRTIGGPTVIQIEYLDVRLCYVIALLDMLTAMGRSAVVEAGSGVLFSLGKQQ
jgi:hypothetical protein